MTKESTQLRSLIGLFSIHANSNSSSKLETIEGLEVDDFIQVGRDVFRVINRCFLVDRSSASRVFDGLDGGKCILAFLKGTLREEGEFDQEFSYEGFLKPVGTRSDERFGKIESEWNICN